MADPQSEHAKVMRYEDGIDRCVLCRSTQSEIEQGIRCVCLASEGGTFCFRRKGHEGECKRSIIGG